MSHCQMSSRRCRRRRLRRHSRRRRCYFRRRRSRRCRRRRHCNPSTFSQSVFSNEKKLFVPRMQNSRPRPSLQNVFQIQLRDNGGLALTLNEMAVGRLSCLVTLIS